jgi:biotin transport system substrate-specific component
MSVLESHTNQLDQTGVRTGRRFLAVALGAATVAVAAQASVPLPFSVVPMTLSPLAVLLVGGILGARGGVAAVATYVALGALGLPVYALGLAGPAILVGPTGGYLLAFPVAAGVTGWLARKGGFGRAMVAAAAGVAVIHLGGWAQLTLLTGDPAMALRLGTLPFLPGDIVKVVLAAAGISGLGPSLRRLL